MHSKSTQLILILIAFTILGCDKLTDSDKPIDIKSLRQILESQQSSETTTQSSSETTIQSSSGKSQLDIPTGWKRESGNRTKDGDLFEIQVGMKRGNATIFVIEEPLIDFDHNFSLNKYTDITLGFIKEELKQARIFSGPFNVNINGMHGRQHVIKGTADGIKGVLLHTTLKGRHCFYQILAITSPSRLEKDKEELLKIVRSFRESS